MMRASWHISLGALVSTVACGVSLTGGTVPAPDAGPLDASLDASTTDGAREASGDDSGVTFLPEDPAAPDCTARAATNPYRILSWAGPMAIDGSASDWPVPPTWQPMAVRLGAVPAVCAEFAAMWSKDEVYLLARVKDANHETTPDLQNLFNNDEVEVMFGPPAGLTARGEYRASDVQWAVDHGGRNAAYPGGYAAQAPIRQTAPYIGRAREWAWGFTVELRIPKAMLGGADLSDGDLVPIAVGAADGDGRMQTGYSFWGVAQPTGVTICTDYPPTVTYCCETDVVSGRGAYCNTRFWGRLLLAPRPAR